MSFQIHFTLNRKPYTAFVTEESSIGSTLWVVEVENGSMYLFSKTPKGWHCAELGKDTCRIIGRAIEAQLEPHAH